MANSDFIGVCDSGVGGISVLKHLVKELPNEHFIFFGDSAHAPYGNKSPEQVTSLTGCVVSNLIESGAKAIVLACNTATAVAAESLRAAYPNIPIIGVEPALKPAVTQHPFGRIVVLATPLTLVLDKYQNLAKRLESTAEVIPLACDGLAERIEQGNLDAPDMLELIESLVGRYRNSVDGAVLGCTHYPFVADSIGKVLGTTMLYDGGAGTARQLHRRLNELKLLAPANNVGSITFASSKDTPDELKLYRWFFARAIQGSNG